MRRKILARNLLMQYADGTSISKEMVVVTIEELATGQCLLLSVEKYLRETPNVEYFGCGISLIQQSDGHWNWIRI